VLDNALRAAAFNRGVHVRLLVSCWLNTDPTMFPYLRSLQALSNPSAGISVDVVRIPPRWAREKTTPSPPSRA
jgi:phospholipase D3/4